MDGWLTMHARLVDCAVVSCKELTLTTMCRHEFTRLSIDHDSFPCTHQLLHLFFHTEQMLCVIGSIEITLGFTVMMLDCFGLCS